METRYCGRETDFVLYIKGLGDKAELRGIDGHFRWIVTEADGTQFIARPDESKPE